MFEISKPYQTTKQMTKNKKGLKKSETGDIKLPMSLCCKCGGIFGNKPFENHKMGPFSDFQGLISIYPATFTAQ